MKKNIYVGSISGIYNLELNNTHLSLISKHSDAPFCSYLTQYNGTLYSTVEISGINNHSGGFILKYSKKNDHLTLDQQYSSFGKNPCYISFDPIHNFLYTANYQESFFNIFKINKHSMDIEKKIYKLDYKQKNTYPHYIGTSPDMNYLFTIAKGNDYIGIYKINYLNNKLSLQLCYQYNFPLHTEPRHICHYSNDIFYVITEASCELYKFKISNNQLLLLDYVSLLKPGQSKKDNYTGCAIKLSNDKRFIYATIRELNCISVFNIEQGFKLVQNISSFGKIPRDIQLVSNDIALVANTDSSNISIFKIDTDNGFLKYCNSYSIDSPFCIL